MANRFLISDTHFGHANILNFKLDNGWPMRVKDNGFPFVSVEEMDEYMVDRWNAVVKPEDKVYHLGDVAMKKRGVEILSRLNGHKRLVRGNHDIFETKMYMKYFEDIYGARVLDGLIMTHIPIHPDSIREGWVNVHGHTHNNQVPEVLGPRYFNVCVEMINYTPVAFEDVKKAIAEGRLTV